MYEIDTMHKKLLSLAALIITLSSYGQTVTNGSFSSGTTGWGCNPETGIESVYGGPSGTNFIAEVDEAAGLCQTISGFTIGTSYRLNLEVSRRTTCGPALQAMTVTIGNLTGNVSRNGTAFAFAPETFTFTATATTLTLNFSATTAGTCNLILDNVSISPITALPVELTAFSASVQDDSQVAVNWSTASENRNDYFTVERSQDGTGWESVATIAGTNHTDKSAGYTFTDAVPFTGISYYRLSQTDLEGKQAVLGIQSVEISAGAGLTVFPNPSSDLVTVRGTTADMHIYSLSGEDVSNRVPLTAGDQQVVLSISNLAAGTYLLQTSSGRCRLVKR